MEQTKSKVIECLNHPSQEAVLAYTSKFKDSYFCCLKCMLKDQASHSFVEISEIKSCDEFLPIQNWPLKIDDKSYLLLTEMSTKSLKVQLRESILTFYKSIKSQLLQDIEDLQTRDLNIIETIHLDESEVINFYNEKFKRKELQDIFERNSKNILTEYQSLVVELEKSRKKDLATLSQMIDQYQKVQDVIAANQLEKTKQIVAQISQKIAYFPPQFRELSQPKQKVQIENLNVQKYPYSQIPQQQQILLKQSEQESDGFDNLFG